MNKLEELKELEKTLEEIKGKFYPIWHCIEERDYERWRSLKDIVGEIRELLNKIDPDKARMIDLIDTAVEQKNWCEATYWAGKIMKMLLW